LAQKESPNGGIGLIKDGSKVSLQQLHIVLSNKWNTEIKQIGGMGKIYEPLGLLTSSLWGQHYGYHNSASQVLHLHRALSCTLPVSFLPSFFLFVVGPSRHFYGLVRRDLFVAAELFNNVGMHSPHSRKGGKPKFICKCLDRDEP